MIIWIMGLNGAGKSSVARELERILARRGVESVILDGNHLREVFEQSGYDRASRIALGIRYAELAKTLSAHSNKAVIIAANGMLSEVCEYNRAYLPDYYEVFLDVPLEVLKKRDSAGIYSRFEAKLVKNVGGLDLEVDRPEAHLCVGYDERLTPADIAQKIDDFLLSYDVCSPVRVQSEILSTKAQTLANLSDKLRYAQILPLWILTKKDFLDSEVFARLLEELSVQSQLFVVRSSSKNEDTQSTSNAGAFESVLSVELQNLKEAIFRVFASYQKHRDSEQEAFGAVDESEEVLIQPMAQGIECAGVVFNAHPKSNAPYYVIEYSVESTSAITSGESATQTFYVAKHPDVDENILKANPYIERIVGLMRELESLIPNTPLDVEFGVTNQGIYCFQVRPLVLQTQRDYPSHRSSLMLLRHKIDEILKPHPCLYGEKGILGVMPDWNPAEIIGLHPRPLAFSLYARLITDSIYATERARYGYKDVSANPLIYNLHGRPYVDVRASFNSFLPEGLSESLSKKLVNFYLDQLRANPQWHDKVEFEILFDSYYFDTPRRLENLKNFGFSAEEISSISTELNMLTNAIISEKIYTQDIAKLEVLSKKREQILNSHAPLLEKIYWLLQDCKNYGTSAFVGLARLGFMAMGFLNSLLKEGILSSEQKDSFVASLECVTSRLGVDLQSLDKTSFLRKYGHLRPGTYDILSPRYDENFEFYFKNNQVGVQEQGKEHKGFMLNLSQMKRIDELLKQHKIHCDVLGFFDFIATGITYRESSKFEFSKNLSEALRFITQLGREYGLSSEDMSYCDVDIFFKAYSTSNNLERLILESIEFNKSSHQLQQAIILPPLLNSGEDVFCFSIGESMPNFITQKRVQAPVVWLKGDEDRLELKGKIVCISRADPGFDWIFSHQILGLLTEFGGANSHMAIRANELEIPAVIGCGDKFALWAGAGSLDIDCANAKVEIL